MYVDCTDIKNILHFLIILKGQYDRLVPYMTAFTLLCTHRRHLPSKDKILFLHPLNMRFLCNFVTMDSVEVTLRSF